MTNYYPGQGLTIGTAILGNTVGQAYPEGTVFTLCKIYGKILTIEGEPVGAANSELVNNTEGTLLVVDGWDGIKVSAKISVNVDNAGSVISIKSVDTITNSFGYFEFHVIQGLIAVVSSSAFSGSVTVDTTALTSVDISTLI